MATQMADTRPKYAVEYVPDTWLLDYEAEAPGYIRAVRGQLNNCYIKEQVTVSVWAMQTNADGTRSKTKTGYRTAYVWVRVE